MAECKNCIHAEVCDQSSRQVWGRMVGETECTDFKSTADVVEVRHGEWVCVNESENVWMCDGKNGCGNEILLLEGTPNDNEWNYCPNCGAKMDGKGEG